MALGKVPTFLTNGEKGNVTCLDSHYKGSLLWLIQNQRNVSFGDNKSRRLCALMRPGRSHSSVRLKLGCSLRLLNPLTYACRLRALLASSDVFCLYARFCADNRILLACLSVQHRRQPNLAGLPENETLYFAIRFFCFASPSFFLFSCLSFSLSLSPFLSFSVLPLTHTRIHNLSPALAPAVALALALALALHLALTLALSCKESSRSSLIQWHVMSYVTYEWIMSHIWMSHVTHTNESCHPYKWVMPPIRMSHVTHMKSVQAALECCSAQLVMSWHQRRHVQHHIPTSHVAHVNVSCHAYKRVISHIRISYTTHTNKTYHTHEESSRSVWMQWRAMSHVIHECDISPVRMSHVTHTNESYYTYQWIMSQLRMSYVTHTKSPQEAPECVARRHARSQDVFACGRVWAGVKYTH